ncbi:MAG: hypothetical protein NTZ46_06435 [Verrucomicrobia bacterium]|nr:hypothetical protein [Verrucomicrobiota bacterium]
MKTAVALLLLLFCACVAQAAPPDLWPLAAKAPADLKSETAALISTPIPGELKPAAQFQKLFLKILATTASKVQMIEPTWVNELRPFIAADREKDPIAHGLAEVARAWLARAQMRQIDVLLHQYYRENVRFPEQFAIVESSVPEALRLDPWGQPWAYKAHAPQGLEKLTGQRYQLGPAHLPDLGPCHTPAALPGWSLAVRHLGDKRVLEIRTGSTTATLQPGGKTGVYTLLYLEDRWALLAGPDQLFAVTF